MLRKLRLKTFKCFTSVDLDLAPLTVLAGVNGGGKSTVIQALILLHQALSEFGQRRSTLPLGGPLVTLGSLRDVINQGLGGSTFGIGLGTRDFRVDWTFSGGENLRGELAARVAKVSWSGGEQGADELLPPDFERHAAGAVIAEMLRRLKYVPADRLGPAEVYPLDEPARHDALGARAERSVGAVLWKRDDVVDESRRHPDRMVPPLLGRQVEACLRDLFPGVRIDFQRVQNASLATLGVRTSDSNDFHRSYNVGFGITYALPLVVALMTAQTRGLVILENPEAHLHAGAQVQIARLAVRFAAAGGQVILETHSDHVLNAIRVAVARNLLTGPDVAIHWFQPDPESGAVSPRRITVDGRGRLNERPAGFFDEIDRQLTDLLESDG